MNPNLATTLNLGIVPATPKSKSVPSLGTALDSSSPAGSEAITPLETQERRESFITCNNLRTLTLAAEDLQDDTGMSKTTHFISYLPHFHHFTHLDRSHHFLTYPSHSFIELSSHWHSVVTASRHLHSPSSLEAHPALNSACCLLLTPHFSPLTPHSSFLTLHSSLFNPHSSPLTAQLTRLFRYLIASFRTQIGDLRQKD